MSSLRKSDLHFMAVPAIAFVVWIASGCAGETPSQKTDAAKTETESAKDTEATKNSTTPTSSSNVETNKSETSWADVAGSTASDAGSSTKNAKSTKADNWDELSLEPATPDDFKKGLERMKGNVVLVLFWATSSAPSRDQVAKSIDLDRKYHAEGLRVVTYSLDQRSKEIDEEILKFLKEQHATFATNLVNDLNDSKSAIEQLEITDGALPHCKVYDRQGKLVATLGEVNGTFPEQGLETAVNAALKELEPEPNAAAN